MPHKREFSFFSFVTLWVLNPMVILLYQNCAMLPNVGARAETSRAPEAKVREPSASSPRSNLANLNAQDTPTDKSTACESKDCLKFE